MPKSIPRRRFLKYGSTSGLLAGSTALAGCQAFSGDDDGDESTLTLGVVSNLELDAGKATVRGAEVAAEVINEEGEFDRELEVISADSQGSSTGAVEAYSSIIEREGADVTLGLFNENGAVTALSEIAQQEKIHLNIGAVTPQLPAQLREDYESNKYWFRFAPPNSQFFGIDFLQFAEQYMVNEQEWTSTAIFREDDVWTEEVTPFLMEEFPNIGLEVVDDLVFPIDTSNFTPYFSDLEDMDIDCVFGMSAEAGRAPIQSYLQSNLDLPMIGDLVAVQSPEFPDDIGEVGQEKDVIGRTHSTWSAEAQTEASRTILERWEETYDSRPTKPTWAGLGSYAATNALANAVSRAGTIKADDLIPEIEAADYELFQRYQVFGQDEEDPLTGETFPHDLKYGEDNYMSTWSRWDEDEQVTVWPPKFSTETS